MACNSTTDTQNYAKTLNIPEKNRVNKEEYSVRQN
jgi:hypothetical protein